MLLRIWRNGAGEIEQRWMDEHIILNRGRAALLEGGDLVDHNLNGLDAWIAKHNRYATLAMVDYLNREHRAVRRGHAHRRDGQAPAKRNRFLKNSVYARLPLYLRAVLMYVYRYVFRLGFLDGRVGLVFHFLHGLWLFMLIDAKLDEARDFIKQNGVEAFKQNLRAVHRIDL